MGPFLVIRPFPTTWRGGGNGWRRIPLLIPSGQPVPVLDRRSSFAFFFPLGIALALTLEADSKAPPWCLRAAADFLTIALYLPASIPTKGWKQMLEKKADKPNKVLKLRLMSIGKSMLPSSYKHQFRATTKRMVNVKDDQILSLPLLKRYGPNSSMEAFLLIANLQMNLS